MARQSMNDKFDTLSASIEEVKDLLRSVSDKVSTMEKEAIASSTSLVARHESNFERIASVNKRLDDLESRTRALEVLFEKTRTLDAVDIVLEKRIAETEKAVDAINKALPKLEFSNRILVWLAGALGLSVISLIVSIITGQVHLVFP